MPTAAPPWRSVAFAVAITLAIGLWIVAVDLLAAVFPLFSGFAGALVALAMLALPLFFRHTLPIGGDPWGVGPGPLGGAIALGVVASAVVLLPFALGYDAFATRYWGQTRFAGEGVPSRGWVLQGEPPAALPGTVAVWERGDVLVVRNDRVAAIVVRPACAGCAPRTLATAAREVLVGPAAEAFVVVDHNGAPLPAGAIRLGRHAVPGEAPFGGQRSLAWLLWLLLEQVVLVALPEEALFRGLLLGRLRAALPPRRRLLGVPFGLAHVLCAALFAAVHLAATPQAHRLLVFFPGLLFCWLAERARHVAAPVVHHALANVWLQALGRLYG